MLAKDMKKVDLTILKLDIDFTLQVNMHTFISIDV